MTGVKWIKLSTDLLSNRKIKEMRGMKKGDGLVLLWVALLCFAGSINDGGRVYLTKGKAISGETLSKCLDFPKTLVIEGLTVFASLDMTDERDGELHIKGWDEYQDTDRLEMIRSYGRTRTKKWREGKKPKKAEG